MCKENMRLALCDQFFKLQRRTNPLSTLMVSLQIQMGSWTIDMGVTRYAARDSHLSSRDGRCSPERSTVQV